MTKARPLSRLRPRVDGLEARVTPSTLPTNFSEAAVATGLSGATTLEFSPDGKLFVAEQAGTMEVWQGGTRLQANFFQANPLVTQTVSERGLLGVAFDPNYASNRFVYVYYTTTASDNHNRLSRFTANASGDLAVAGSEAILMELDPHSAGNHNGGAIHFGPDGKLYLAVGDNAQGANSQSLANRHGKILRINADGTIPSDNPTTFPGIAGSTSGVNRSIWAVGLRNPYTFTFQAGTGRMHINDVGQNTWEEINLGAVGANYGWATTEGDFNQASFPSFTRPVYAYSHGGGTFQGFAITGGAFYNPASPGIGVFPGEYTGDYFFADFVNDWINVIDLGTGAVTRFATGAPGVVDLRVAPDGALHYLARDEGRAYRVAYTANQAPAIAQGPASQSVGPGGPATFTVTATGSSPLSYRWQRAEAGTSDWLDISGATTPSFTVSNAQASDNGDRFRVVVSNPFGNVTSDAATLTVTGNQLPTATLTITAGLTGGKFIAGQQVTFSGSASDPEDGTLGADRFTWRVDYITSIASGNPAVRPFVAEFTGATSGTFTPSTTGPYTLTDVAYRVTLTVRDSAGQARTVSQDVAPNVARLTVTTSPAGLQVTVDGQPSVAPIAFDSVVGFERPIGAAASQSSGGVTYNFSSWSDGGAATHTISTPAVATTYTATYVAAPSQNPNPGLKAEFFDYTSALSVLPNLSARIADVTRTDANISYPGTTGTWAGLDSRFADTFVSRHTGYVRIDAAGPYTFYLDSDDGSKLWLDGTLMVDNDGLHSARERSATRTLAAGLHPIRVEFFENGGTAGLTLSWSGPGIAKAPVPAAQFVAGAFAQAAGADGLVSVEAEANDANVSQGGKAWTPFTATAGYSGRGALQTTPNTGVNQDTGYVAASPRLDFRINFVKTGVHYVWVRGRGPGGADDSVHAGLDGAAVATADRITSFPTAGYGWSRSTMDGPLATINVATPGLHTLNLWMREDGTIVDKVVLTTSSTYAPNGTGPAESPRTDGTSGALALRSVAIRRNTALARASRRADLASSLIAPDPAPAGSAEVASRLLFTPTTSVPTGPLRRASRRS